MKSAGQLSPHSLRHTFASSLDVARVLLQDIKTPWATPECPFYAEQDGADDFAGVLPLDESTCLPRVPVSTRSSTLPAART